MLCMFPVLSAVAHSAAGQITWGCFVKCSCDSRQLLTYASNQSKRCIPQIWLLVSYKKQTNVSTQLCIAISIQLCIAMTDATLCTCYNILCRVQLLCTRQQRNAMKQWFNCFWSMEPTLRPGPNMYACSFCARLCTVFLMQLLHESFLAQQYLLLSRFDAAASGATA